MGEEERRRAEQEERARLTTLLPAPSEARGQTTLPPPTEPAVGKEERRRAVETAVRRAGRTPPGQRQLAAQPPPVRGEVDPRLTVEVGRSRGVFNIFVEHTFVAQAFPPRGEAAAVGAESHWQPATNTLQICVTHTPGVRAYDTISPENRQWLEEIMSVHLDLIFEEVNQLPPPLMDATEEPSRDSWGRISEWLHTSLDLSGLIPGYGEVADAFNALFYIAEGRFGDAAISALAIIPFVGSVGTAGRVAVRGVRRVRGATTVPRIASELPARVVGTGVLEAGAETTSRAVRSAVTPGTTRTVEDLVELRRLAPSDPAAADRLVSRYEQMSDFELFQRFVDEADETASAIIRRRYPDNEAALRRVLGRNYRPPHSATAILRRSGREVRRETFESGHLADLPAEERALPFPRNIEATHTERWAIRRIDLHPRDFLEIRGQYDPCRPCQRAMQEAATSSGATIRYWWQGGSMIFRP